MFRHLLFGVLALSLIGCTGYKSENRVKSLNMAEAVGSPFTQELARYYRDFATREHREMFDYADALHFAQKGLEAAKGKDVAPENIEDWRIREQDKEDILAARARLMDALNRNARGEAPKLAAMAQGHFDCWIEQQEEFWQDPDEIAGCKDKFADAMDDLMAALSDKTMSDNKAKDTVPVTKVETKQQQSTAPPQTPVTQEEDPVNDATFMVFFNFDSTAIARDGQEVVTAASDEILSTPIPDQITIIGHADQAGPQSYNLNLSRKRANAVKEALVSQGVPENIITIDAKGETAPLVETGGNMREPANRRVDISFDRTGDQDGE